MPSVMHSGRRRSINEINMVPFIDVMLVLLIIFMVTATVIVPGVINIPSAGKSSRTPDNYVTVTMDASGALQSNTGKGTPMEAANRDTDLVDHVKAAIVSTPTMPVLIAADKNLPYQQVITIMGKLRDAGVQRIALTVK